MGVLLISLLLLLWGQFRALSLSQEIEILNLNQEDFISSCREGLINHVDTFRVQSKIHLNGRNYEKYLATYEIKKAFNEEFEEMFRLDLKDECTGFQEQAEYYCVEFSKEQYHINITLQALPMYSDAKIRGHLAISSTTKFTSNVQQLPRAQDPNQVLGILKINGKKISDQYCNETVDAKSLFMEFDCAGAAKPCVIQMKINDSIVIEQSEDSVKYRYLYENGNDLLVLVKYAACTLNGKTNFINCTIKSVYYQESNDNQGSVVDNLLIYVLTPLCILSVCIGILFFIYRHLKNKKNKEHFSQMIELVVGHQSCTENDDFHPIGEILEKEAAFNQHPCDLHNNKENDWTSFIKALEKTNKRTISRLTRGMKSVNKKYDDDDWTLLMFASRHGNDTIVKALIEIGADVEARTKYNWSSLMFASYGGSVETVSTLIEKGADVNAVTDKNINALMIALLKNCIDAAEELIYAEIDLSLKCQFGWTALMMASEKGMCRIVFMIIQKGNVDVNVQNDEGFTALMLASKSGYYECVFFLLEKGAQTDLIAKNKQTARSLASINKHNEIDTLLLRYEQNYAGNLELNNDPSRVFARNTKLIEEIENNKYENVANLLKNGAKIDEQINEGYTALMVSAKKGYCKITQLLIDKRANINVKNNKGYTAYMLAIMAGFHETAKIFENEKQ